jgi:acetyl esterase
MRHLFSAQLPRAVSCGKFVVSLLSALFMAAPVAAADPPERPPAGVVEQIANERLTAKSAVSGPPAAIWNQIQDMGPVLDGASVYRIYAPVRTAMPSDGVKRTSDVPYGSDAAQKLDIYQPESLPAEPMPVLVFMRGGGFVGGTNKVYDNIGNFLARQGILAVLPNYRLAPTHPWPTGAQDTGAAVRWAKENVAKHGGDPNRIILYGHSAGAVHSAAYALEKRFQPAGGSGLAGVMLASGMYNTSLDAIWGVPWVLNVDRSYYGSDLSLYKDRSTALTLDAPPLPTLVSFVELDPLEIVVSGAELFTRLCQRDGRCPTLVRYLRHNHFSALVAINTGDTTVTTPMLDFIRSTTRR